MPIPTYSLPPRSHRLPKGEWSRSPYPVSNRVGYHLTETDGKPDAGVDEQLKEVKDAIPLILAGKPASVSYHRLVEDCRRLDLDSTVDVSSVYKCIDKELKKTVKSMAREGRADILSRQGSWLLRIVQLWDTYQNRVVSVST